MKKLILTFAFLIYATVAQAQVQVDVLDPSQSFDEFFGEFKLGATIDQWAIVVVKNDWGTFNPYVSEPENVRIQVIFIRRTSKECGIVQIDIRPLDAEREDWPVTVPQSARRLTCVPAEA